MKGGIKERSHRYGPIKSRETATRRKPDRNRRRNYAREEKVNQRINDKKRASKLILEDKIIIKNHHTEGGNKIFEIKLLNQDETRALLLLLPYPHPHNHFNPHPVNSQLRPRVKCIKSPFTCPPPQHRQLPLPSTTPWTPSHHLRTHTLHPSQPPSPILPVPASLPTLVSSLKIFPFPFAPFLPPPSPSGGLAWRQVTIHLPPLPPPRHLGHAPSPPSPLPPLLLSLDPQI